MLSTILLAALAVSGGIFLLYLKTGGDRAFRRWILHVAKPAQDEAWARLHQAMDMGTPRTTHERCSDLVSGLDDWWSSLERSKRPLSWVSRSKLPLVLVIITSAFSLAAKRFHDFVGGFRDRGHGLHSVVHRRGGPARALAHAPRVAGE